MAVKTFDNWAKDIVGKNLDLDGCAGVQCVDVAHSFMRDVLGLPIQARGNAVDYWKNPVKQLKDNFKFVKNTPTYVPKKGVMVVFNATTTNPYGHIAVTTDECTVDKLVIIEQNCGVKTCRKHTHTYTNLCGFLEPKNRSNIDAKAVSKTTFKKGDYTLTDNMNVRTGAGTKYAIKKRAQITKDGQAHAINQTYACLKIGTVVTVSEVKKISDKEYWGKIPSGWIALMHNGTKYVK